MRFVLALTYDIDFKDWNMDCINKVNKINRKVSNGIALELQHLWGKKLEEIQQF